ncbi:MAG: hypothetical protein PHU56_04390, partial [Candidatus Pacebacteria bacterium]|nr:hypothetical protein [Candidatus Paceibacterota bacterium]
GTIDDTVSGGTGVKLTLPPQALGSDTSNASISVKETSSVGASQSFDPFAGKAKEITATDNSGQPITNLNDYVDLEIVIYKADVDAEVASGAMVDKTKLKTMQVGYWDSTTNDWVTLPTTRAAYYKATADATEWTLYPDFGATPGYEKFIDDALSATPTFTGYTDYKLVLKALTNHFSVFGATQPTDSLLPSAPAGLSQTSGNGSSVGLSWSAVSTNFDSTVITDLLGYQIYRSTNGSTYSQISTTTSSVSYSDATVNGWTSYYYKVTASDDGGNETSLASSTALRLCSNSSVDNGTVSDSCSITCNSGYTQSGNSCVSSGGAIILGGGGGDSIAPSIGDDLVVPENTQATITWTTNEASLSWVAYGTSTAYGLEQKTSLYKTSHSVVLTGLQQGTVYHYQLKSQDSSGNIGSYVDKTFTTSGTSSVTVATSATSSQATSTASTSTATASTTVDATFTVPSIEKPINEMTADELQLKITEIAQFIAALQVELRKMTGPAVTLEGIPSGFIFSKTLKLGMSDIEVRYLQVVLNSDPETELAGEGIGSAGKETDYFGGKTKQAVIEFQEKYASEILDPVGLAKGTGLVGSSTRAMLNSLLGR